MTAAGIYRAALHLYPRSFRSEYGDDMVALFDAQYRDERSLRVIARAVTDLALTVPTCHLEARMSRSSTTTVVTILVVLGVIAALIGGRVGALASLGAIAVAVATWKRSGPLASPGDERWWKLLLGGIALFGVLIAVTTATGELASGPWLVAMGTGLVAITLTALGVVLGINARFRRALH